MSSSPARRRAFTLVEMLVAMVLTLLLVTAIAEFYAIVGESVKDGRAMIEMGGQLRAAVQRLKADLDLITVTVAPWTDEGSASGYFEYFEGIANDYNANANFTGGLPQPDASEDLDGNGTPDLIDLAVTNTLGDGDDFLAFTIRSNGQPFTGRYSSPPGLNPSIITSGATPASLGIITSQLAEVVWWVGFDDIPPLGSVTGNNKWDFNEPRQVYRRQLLIRPELGQLGGDYQANQWSVAQQDLMRFWQYNDVSASIRGEFVNLGSGPVLVYRIRANSLSDLTKRENRFAHMPNQVSVATPSGAPPYLVDGFFPHSAVTVSSPPTLLLPCLSAKSPGAKALTSYALQMVNGVPGESQGEDIILPNVLAFDVQVFDPYARVWPDDPTTPTAALVPSDPGYLTAALNTPAAGLLGLGAFVDLNYYSYLIPNYVRNLTAQAFTPDTVKTAAIGYQPYFAGAPSVPPYMTAAQQLTYAGYFGYVNGAGYVAGATYDTWAYSYERDGVDQSGNGSYDLQTNGIDDNGDGVVDDVNERDTIPPYSQALRGLQVKIRLYEPSTRQVRQATVATDFITE